MLLYIRNILKEANYWNYSVHHGKELKAGNYSTWIKSSAVQLGAGRQRGRVHWEPAHRAERLRYQDRSKNDNEASRKGEENPWLSETRGTL